MAVEDVIFIVLFFPLVWILPLWFLTWFIRVEWKKQVRKFSSQLRGDSSDSVSLAGASVWMNQE